VSCALAQEGNMNAELLRIVLNGDEWLSCIQNWRLHDDMTAMHMYTYDQDGRLRKRRLKIGPPRTQPVCISPGGTTTGSTMMAGPFAPYTGSQDGQPAQNGDGGQPNHGAGRFGPTRKLSLRSQASCLPGPRIGALRPASKPKRLWTPNSAESNGEPSTCD
jgi:hypothetical protein